MTEPTIFGTGLDSELVKLGNELPAAVVGTGIPDEELFVVSLPAGKAVLGAELDIDDALLLDDAVLPTAVPL